MKEIWKNINGYKRYQVSNFGRVRSFCVLGHGKKQEESRILTPDKSNNGYLRVSLSKNGKTKKHSIHRLVAKAFCKGYDKDLQVNHKDGDKANNHYLNLEWVTDSHNKRHAIKTGLTVHHKGSECHQTNLTEDDILQIRSVHEQGWANMRELAEAYLLNKTSIWEILHRKTWKHI